MAINCKNCEFHDVDYVWNDECEDEVREESCANEHWDELENDESECPYFKKYRQKRYVEKFTKCDSCEFKSGCGLIEITMLQDTSRHYIPMSGNMCKTGAF